eukprot:scaffold4418_cov86-Skeletonema_dohrnii-CCMP3373.AAC.3
MTNREPLHRSIPTNQLSPSEQAYYDALFTAADKSSTGYLSGPTAVEFLSLSKLPVDLLKTIWSMADQNPTNNTLDKPKFAVAVRLIQLFQNGKKPVDLELNLSPEDGVVPMRPPFFEGVNLQQPPPPQQQVQQPVPQQHSPQRSPQPSPPMQPMSSPMRSPTNSISMNGGMGGMSTPSTIGTAMSTNPNYNNNPPPTTTALATQDPYTMTPTEQTRYTALFPTYATIEPNYVHGAQAVELFLKSGMDRNQLKAIWTMCDDDPVDNKLDVVEFAIAMHLIVCVTKKGLGLPQVLPASLVRVRRESRMQQQQGQQGQQQYEQQYEQQGIPTPTQNNMGGASVVGGMSTMQPPPPQQQQQQQEGGIPSPEKMSGMGGQNMGMMQGGGMTMMPSPEQQQPQMVRPPPQMVQQQQPQMSMQQQPQMGMQQQPGMMQQQQQQPPEQQQMGMANGHAGGFGNGFGSSGALGGETVDDAFAGLPNDPIPDVDAYSAIGGPAPAEQQPTIPALPLAAAPSPVLQSMAPPSSSPNMAPVQASQAVPPPPPAAISMPSPKSPKRNVAIPGNANAELEELRAAHQKLQAEAVSLRAKAGLVSDEEQEAQADIAKVASEIATLSTELEGLRTQVMEAKVKLTDAVATLKAQKDKKDSLETAVEESRETVDALNAATEALVEANENAMAHQAKAVADAAAAKEEAEEAAAAAAPSADLFSWDSPAPTPAAAPTMQQAPAPDAMQGMGAPWGEQPIASELPAPAPVADAGSVYSTASASAWGGASAVGGMPQQPASVADAGSVYSTNSVHRDSGFSSANSVQRDTSFYSASERNSSMGSMQQHPMAPPANQYPAGMGMGAPPQPMMQQQQQQTMMAPTVNTASQPVQQQLPTIESPTAEQIEQIKNDALVAEKSFRASKDLVKTLSKEVKHLESAAAKAEEEKKAIESKKVKMGGKKKQKKEIEKAYEFAMGEQKKVQEARQQLDAARRQSDIAKNEADKLRQQYEEAEVEAATAASYLSVNASHSMAAGSVGPTGSVAPQQQYQQQYQQPQQQQYQQPAPTNDMFSSDPFGMGGGGMGVQQAESDPYGMGLMGGSADGEYSNPFAM